MWQEIPSMQAGTTYKVRFEIVHIENSDSYVRVWVGNEYAQATTETYHTFYITAEDVSNPQYHFRFEANNEDAYIEEIGLFECDC